MKQQLVFKALSSSIMIALLSGCLSNNKEQDDIKASPSETIKNDSANDIHKASTKAATTPLLKEKKHSIYHAIKNKTLVSVAGQIANRSGIAFQINPEIQNDIVNVKLAGNGWKEALESLLKNYNHSLVGSGNAIKTVIITGRIGSGVASTEPEGATNNAKEIMVTPIFVTDLPKQYQGFAKNSVTKIDLPLTEINSMTIGGTITLDLPIGQYEVTHDNKIEHKEDGSTTWAGYLENEGQGYRVYVSQGKAGVMGNIFTPDGVYNIETTNGQTYLVDTLRSGIKDAGFENDTLEEDGSHHDEDAAMGEAIANDEGNTMNADVGTDPLLKPYIDRIDNLTARIDKLTAQLDDAKNELSNLPLAYTNAANAVNQSALTIKNINDAIKTTNKQIAALNKQRPLTAEIKASISTLKASLAASKLALKKETKNKAALSKNAKTLKTAYNKTVKNETARLNWLIRDLTNNLNSARNDYQNAIYALTNATNALNAIKNDPVTTVGPVENPVIASDKDVVIDAAVFYTTESQTKEFAEQRIRYLNDITNQSYKDSGVNVYLNISYLGQTDIPETGSNADWYLYGKNNGYVMGAVSKSKSDVILLFRPLYNKNNNNCGMAGISLHNDNGAERFAAISDGYGKDNSSIFCQASSYAHEVGHLLGNAHDRKNSVSQWGGYRQGAFSYSYAFSNTIMSYESVIVMLYSSPLLGGCIDGICGYPEGNALESDQVKSMNIMAPMIAGIN